jgi:glutamate-ammonia-ligase adenylyltransferase
MMEVAFIAEALQLIHGPADPEVFRANTSEAFKALSSLGYLPEADAMQLIAADFLWRSIQGIDRLTGLRETEIDPPAAMLTPLLRATATPDLPALRVAMAQASKRVREYFNKYISE